MTLEGLRDALIGGGQAPEPVRAALRAYADWAHRTGKKPNQRNTVAFDAIDWLGLPDDAARRLAWKTYQDLLLKADDEPRDFIYTLTKGFAGDEPRCL